MERVNTRHDIGEGKHIFHHPHGNVNLRSGMIGGFHSCLVCFTRIVVIVVQYLSGRKHHETLIDMFRIVL